MPLAAIGTDRHLRSRINQAKVALVCSGLHSFINEIEINLNTLA
jgi:hypothetical protein